VDRESAARGGSGSAASGAGNRPHQAGGGEELADTGNNPFTHAPGKTESLDRFATTPHTPQELTTSTNLPQPPHFFFFILPKKQLMNFMKFIQ
jgi:hypothetical protein